MEILLKILGVILILAGIASIMFAGKKESWRHKTISFRDKDSILKLAVMIGAVGIAILGVYLIT